MASFSVEDFVGNGSLKRLLPKLWDKGWNDVPTIKIMNSDDMDAMNMTQQQKEALEIRNYLHDCALVQYGDKLEASGKSLPEILSLTSADLSAQFGMKRGHISRFMNRSIIYKKELNSKSPMKVQSMSSYSDFSSNIKDGHIFKGIVASGPADPRACGCVKAPSVCDDVAPYSAIEGISVQKLTPEYKLGMDTLVKIKAPPMKVSELWHEKPAVIICIRRPGCIMCRAEAHQLYLKKPIFDALGVQLIAVIREHIETEVQDFWPRYWGGIVIFDMGMGFFKALGGGQLMKDKFISGFLFNLRAITNYKRAKAMGIKQNFKGEGEIKGGLFIVGKEKRGIAYQFVERNFGDWAPLDEVIDICTKLQSR